MKNHAQFPRFPLLILFLLVFSFAMTFTACASTFNTPSIALPESLPLSETIWDLTALDNWCGGPNGKLRVIGAFKVEDGVLETEDGHQWKFDLVSNPFEFEALYLMWIDDMGTEDMADDQPIKIWKEIMF